MSNIVDEILYEERLFKDKERGNPRVIVMNYYDYSKLLEYYDVEEMTYFHGMRVELDKDQEDIILE